MWVAVRLVTVSYTNDSERGRKGGRKEGGIVDVACDGLKERRQKTTTGDEENRRYDQSRERR